MEKKSASPKKTTPVGSMPGRVGVQPSRRHIPTCWDGIVREGVSVDFWTEGQSLVKTLSERFGKILQQRQSVSINRQDTSTSINTQLDFLIPASKISNLSQGTFVGSVADNFGEEIDQKIFHSRIIVDSAKVNAEMKAYKKIPIVNEFKDENGNDIMQEQIERNYSRVKDEVEQIVQDEMERIKADPELRKRLLPDEKDEEDND